MSTENLTVEEVAEILRVRCRTVWDLTKHSDPEKRLPSFKVGKAIRVKKDDLDNWIASHSNTAGSAQ